MPKSFRCEIMSRRMATPQPVSVSAVVYRHNNTWGMLIESSSSGRTQPHAHASTTSHTTTHTHINTHTNTHSLMSIIFIWAKGRMTLITTRQICMWSRIHTHSQIPRPIATPIATTGRIVYLFNHTPHHAPCGAAAFQPNSHLAAFANFCLP